MFLSLDMGVILIVGEFDLFHFFVAACAFYLHYFAVRFMYGNGAPKRKKPIERHEKIVSLTNKVFF
jgi:hypothetical protein